ncbi:MAG TPA: ElyC/SanA/YdcF family protein [Polyangia bacterium]|nr:ElyC/SanA/YdcF family protein [Polyangia bacterium]HVZ85497.1 ElyC/SanA/YdcF family protein [Polyangia bacterium]
MATAQLLRLLLLGGVLAAAALVLPNMWVARAGGAHAYAEVSSSPSRSIAIVPGAAVHRGQPLASLTERLDTALTLYRVGQVKAIFISGVDRPDAPEVSTMQRWLLARGVPASDILSDDRGSRTRNTMLDAAARFGVGDAIVCTQALYVDRAVFLAREAGIDAVGIGVPSPVSRSWRNVGTEALKTALAFYESYLREGPASAGDRVAVALR